MKAILSEIKNIGGYPTVKNSWVNIKDYTEYYKHLECSHFDCVRVDWFGQDISIFIDDEGLMKGGNFGRKVEGYEAPLFGNMVICGGVDSIGNTLDIPDSFDVINISELIGGICYQTKG